MNKFLVVTYLQVLPLSSILDETYTTSKVAVMHNKNVCIKIFHLFRSLSKNGDRSASHGL